MGMVAGDCGAFAVAIVFLKLFELRILVEALLRLLFHRLENCAGKLALPCMREA
jgi:hypothetical protein